MHRLQFHYTLSKQSRAAQVHNPLIALLHAVQQEGSISAAARALHLSYRHVWGELKRWEGELGQILLVWDKGQSAKLSEFGAKLMWAERQAQARLAPQIAALRNDLERAFAVAFDPTAHVLTMHASHDDALALLREQALVLDSHQRGTAAQLHLDVRFTGSVDAMRELNEGRCVLAGFHAQVHPSPDSLTARTYKPLLQPGLHKIIGFATRSQGLMVARGNPLGLHSWQDIQRTHARFVNRPLGTGTRVLLDELLARNGLGPGDISGYAHTEPSHHAAAHAVAAGAADVALGLELAARKQGLDFVPLLTEHYHLVCLKSALGLPAIQSLLKQLQSPAWQHLLASTPGYAPSRSGEVLSLRRVLPWWNFARQKTRHKPSASDA